MVVSHGNREIFKLDLTAPGDCHTKTVWVGDLGMDSWGFAQSGTTSAAKSVVRINLQKRTQFLKGWFLHLAKTLWRVTGWCRRGGRRADGPVADLASTISWLLTLPCCARRKGKLASLEPASTFCGWTLTSEAPWAQRGAVLGVTAPCRERRPSGSLEPWPRSEWQRKKWRRILVCTGNWINLGVMKNRLLFSVLPSFSMGTCFPLVYPLYWLCLNCLQLAVYTEPHLEGDFRLSEVKMDLSFAFNDLWDLLL